MGASSLIRLFVTHRNAANLLMGLAVILGLLAMTRINSQFFPDFDFPMVRVSVVWPGASPEDVEANIIEALEPGLREIDSVMELHAGSGEGFAMLFIRFPFGVDMRKAVSDIEQAINQVRTLPQDAERPQISQVSFFEPLMSIVISGPYSEAALKSYAKDIRNELLGAGISKVNISGARDEEILVEVPEASLRQLDITLQQIAGRIAQTSQDMPSGLVEGEAERQIRSEGLRKDAKGIGNIEIRARNSGEIIYLQDVANIEERFDGKQPAIYRKGQRAMELTLMRGKSEDVLSSSKIAREKLAELDARLPESLTIEIYDVNADMVASRINLLVKNGLGGLLIVMVILFIFLTGRVAFWVAAGIPVAMLATIAVMLWTGQSINMISLFAMIMTLGIIVDDAIVVGEHAAYQRERGMSALKAAEVGAMRMLAPVIAASLTTLASFTPILIVSDEFGQMMKALPLVVIAVVVASLVECFLILPGHLRDALKPDPGAGARWRAAFNRRFDAFRDNIFGPLVARIYDWRYATFAAAVACLLIAQGTIAGGRVPFQFMPEPEAEALEATIVMTPGTSREDTMAQLAEIERSIFAVAGNLKQGDEQVVSMALATLGMTRDREGISGDNEGDNLGQLIVELTPSDHRSVRTSTLLKAWREDVQELPGLQYILLSPRQNGPGGTDIDIRLRGGEATNLKAAADEVKELLARYAGTKDIDDNLHYGKRELVMDVTPRGAALGFTTEEVGRQVRYAFEGAIAKRFARGDEEITVRVQYPRENMTLETLKGLYLISPQGMEVALTEVVNIDEQQNFNGMRRYNGKREVSVMANLDRTQTDEGTIMQALATDGHLQKIADDYGVDWRFDGRIKATATAFSDLGAGLVLALCTIYIILAWVFASYMRPIIVMIIIPFGIVGAVLGHLIMDAPLNMMSIVSLLGLAGILVNDSIILVTTIDEKHDDHGLSRRDAVIEGTKERLRAVLLTSLTTIGGLAPLLFETSMQAGYVKPMAITIAFGLGAATFIVLLVVPALFGIQEDISRFFGFKHKSKRIKDPSIDTLPAE